MANFETLVGPFDATYRRVTAAIEDQMKYLSPNEKRWLQSLVDGFRSERDNWNKTRGTIEYWDKCGSFSWKVLRLSVGAYLHIAYDLPRVIAQEWPEASNDKWSEGPSLLEAAQTYEDLRPIFPREFKRASRDFRVTGAIGLFARFPGAVGFLISWLLHLRDAAWRHANILRLYDPVDRQQREDAMLTAMTTAINEISVLNPLTWLPPSPTLPRVLPAVTITLPGDLDHAWMGAAAVAALWAGVSVALSAARRRDLIAATIISELGARIDLYVSEAIREPSSFGQLGRLFRERPR
jgi:hypothetical protein